MATNEILQILVFSLFFGFALTALKEQARRDDRRSSSTSSHTRC